MSDPWKNAMSVLFKRLSLLFTSSEGRLSTPAFNTAQLVFCSPPIPATEQTLSFGDWNTPAELEALSQFSRLVNSVPNPAERFSHSGIAVWDVYDSAISYAAFPNVSAGMGAWSTLSDDFSEAMALPDPGEQALTAIESVCEYVAERRPEPAGPAELIPAGLRAYVEGLEEADEAAGLMAEEDCAPEALADSFTYNPNPASAYYHKLRSRLRLGERQDKLGPYWPTPFLPADILTGKYRWEHISVSGGESGAGGLFADEWSALKYLTVEVIQLPLLRPWWDPTIFRSQGWKWAMPLGPISDGGMPARGMMPLYITAVILARNLEIRLGVGENPLSGKEESIATPEPHIIGFVCERVPKSPNPDPLLDWE